MSFYKKKIGDEFLGLDPKYLSRSFSVPDKLDKDNGNATLTRDDYFEDLPNEHLDLNNSQGSNKSVLSNIVDDSENRR